MTMRYLSVASGIEAATVAWHPLGWKAAAFSEIEPFPCAVLADRWPETPNLGDMTNYKEWSIDTIDLLVGGTPCQSFSVAGLRGGLDDPRGNLMLVYLAIAERFRPAWIVWENVPGVLSVDGGRAFGSFLGGLAELGYGWAYRVLDAQYFGVPQRRRRVFVVGYLGDWRVAAAVLFERESVRGNPPPSREAGKRVAASITRGVESGGKGGYSGRRREDDVNIVTVPALTASGRGVERTGESRGQDPVIVHRWPVEIAPTLNAHYGDKWGLEDQHALNGGGLFVPGISHALRARYDSSEDGTGRGTPIVLDDQGGSVMNISHDGSVGTLRSEAHQHIPAVLTSSVRRLTPRECERLQGFPDDWTLIPWRGKMAPDGPRYKACGNSMAVPVMAWLGRRVKRVMRILCEA